ncbi:MAG: helix-turn-helix domain-containing protein, partial [Candidatus Cloacimonas sp.]|nr:helix-turn-helix domain-containing protein [Candidatus Cloacimonas sp.]
KRDLSYKKVWEDTRFREEQIRNIEANRWFELGGYGIAKALVFNYARYLEADLDMVMREFSIMMPENTKDTFLPRRTLTEKKIMLSTNFLWMVGIIIFVTILGSILVHAHNQGWLKAPDFFSKPVANSTKTAIAPPPEKAKPDTLRQRMRALSEAIPKEGQSPAPSTNTQSASADTTDYIGNILGDSPLNVPLH